MKAHVATQGNEKADQMAKSGAKLRDEEEGDGESNHGGGGSRQESKRRRAEERKVKGMGMFK